MVVPTATTGPIRASGKSESRFLEADFWPGTTSGLARHPTAIGRKRYRHLLKLEHQQDLEWYILPGTKGPRLGFP